jgi:TPR repeat protein
MTTLMYLKAPALTFEEANLDRKFGDALALKKSDPMRSNKYLHEVAEVGGHAAAAAHREISRRYAWGDTLTKDTNQAVLHLMAAVNLGDPTSMLCLAREYCRPDAGLDDEFSNPRLVPVDREEGLSWFRKSAATGSRTAQLELAELIRNGRSARDCAADEVEEITRNYLSAGSGEYEVGSFYCTDLHSENCSQADIETARNWFLKGHQAGCDQCASALRDADEQQLPGDAKENKRTPAIASTQMTDARKWPLVGAFSSVLGLLVWAVIGSVLLGYITQMMYVTVPLVIVCALASAIYKLFKDR